MDLLTHTPLTAVLVGRRKSVLIGGVGARKSASRRYVEFHLLMPQDITVKAAHAGAPQSRAKFAVGCPKRG